jgi:hypothetical protein
MSRSHLFGIALAAMSSLALLAENAPAQQKPPKEQLVGTWTMTSNTTTRPDGSKVETFGPGAKGIVIFEPNGYHVLIITRSDMPKFASGNRATGTADENKSVVLGSVVYFGTYQVNEADGTYTVQVDGTTFPNWLGTLQKRNYSISGDELTMASGAASAGGSIVSIWHRVK